LNRNNRKSATEALARRMQQQKSAAGRMETEECRKNATDKCRKSAEVEHEGSGRKNATAAAGRRMCREGRESKQCNRNSRKNEVFEMEESSKQCNRDNQAQCHTVADACGFVKLY
jgi:hypothetical protein